MECPYNFQKDLLTFDNKHRKPYWKEGKSMIARERWLRGYISLVEREASRSKKKKQPSAASSSKVGMSQN